MRLAADASSSYYLSDFLRVVVVVIVVIKIQVYNDMDVITDFYFLIIFTVCLLID